MTPLAQASQGHSMGVKADTHLRPLERKQQRQKLRELVGLAPRCLGAEKVGMGPAAEGQQGCSLSRESQPRWQEHRAMDSDRHRCGQLKHSVQGHRPQPCSENLGQLSRWICSSTSKKTHRHCRQIICVSVSGTLVETDNQGMVNSSK